MEFAAAADKGSLTTTVWNQQMSPVVLNLPGGPEAFSSTYDTLYILPLGSGTVDAYDTHTFKLKATYDIGGNFREGTVNSGFMTTSADGKELFITTDSGIYVLNVAIRN